MFLEFFRWCERKKSKSWKDLSKKYYEKTCFNLFFKFKFWNFTDIIILNQRITSVLEPSFETAKTLTPRSWSSKMSVGGAPLKFGGLTRQDASLGLLKSAWQELRDPECSWPSLGDPTKTQDFPFSFTRSEWGVFTNDVTTYSIHFTFSLLTK
jgi:hypothetical protein